MDVDTAAVWAAYLAGGALLVVLWQEFRRWLSRPSTSWRLETWPYPMVKNSPAEWENRWHGRLVCLGDAEAHHVFVRGRHCIVKPDPDDGVMTLIRPAETRGLAFEVEPGQADRAWVAIDWTPPPYRRAKMVVMWWPLNFDGPLGDELQRQLTKMNRRWWLGRYRFLPRHGVGPGKSPLIRVSAVRGRRMVNRAEWAADSFAPEDDIESTRDQSPTPPP